MKRSLLGFLVAFSVTAAPVFAADQFNGKTEITVAGNGAVTLPPDVANVSASVDTNAANAGEAVSRNNAIYDRIVVALGKVGVARADVTLSYYNVNYNPKPQIMPPHPDGERYGYTVSRTFQREGARHHATPDASPTRAASSGATSINDVSLRTRRFFRGARTQATKQSGGRRARERRDTGGGRPPARRFNEERRPRRRRREFLLSR